MMESHSLKQVEEVKEEPDNDPVPDEPTEPESVQV